MRTGRDRYFIGATLVKCTFLPSALALAAPASTQQAIVSLRDYQTLTVAIVSLTVGLITALTWIGSQIITARYRARDRVEIARQEARKQVAFFAVLESEISHVIESLSTSKDILAAIDPASCSLGSWISHVRIASNISSFRSFEHDWDKLYIIGAENIRHLRDFDLALTDVDRAFKRTLSLQEAGRMPLFEPAAEEATRIALAVTSLTEHIDGALEFGQKLQAVAKATVQEEKHAGPASPKPSSIGSGMERIKASSKSPPSHST